MSCGQLALRKAGIIYENYYASEIEKQPISITMDNFPDTIQIGNVLNVKGEDLPEIDLLIAGSPCQGFSKSGNGLNFEHHGSKLYFEFLRLLKETKPKYFLLENVKMDKWCQDVITKDLGVNPVLINSARVTAQNRKRLYWTNIPFSIDIPNKNLYLKDIINIEAERTWIDSNWIRNSRRTTNYLQFDPNNTGHSGQAHRAYFLNKKIGCLHTKSGTDHKVLIGDKVGRLTRNEGEQLQTVPLNYTKAVPEIKAINIMGNGWTVDIITHILLGLK